MNPSFRFEKLSKQKLSKATQCESLDDQTRDLYHATLRTPTLSRLHKIFTKIDYLLTSQVSRNIIIMAHKLGINYQR